MRLIFFGLFILGLLLFLGFGAISGQTPIEPKYLQKLNKTEKDEIMNKCTKTVAKKDSQVTNRIWNGKVAEMGQFPYAAYIERWSGGKWTGMCGATLISWRHAVTAQHCVTPQPASPHVIRFWIGGICQAKDRRYCPDGRDMKELGVRNVAFIKVNTVSKPHGDHAILELNDSVSKDLQLQFGVKFACLPRKHQIVPDEVIAFGWGSTQSSSQTAKPSAVLRYVDLKKITRFPLFDPCKKGKPMLCAISKDNTDRGGSYGDSGGGAVDENGRLQGITQAGGFKPEAGKRYISRFVKVKKLLDFYCKYLDLCMPKI